MTKFRVIRLAKTDILSNIESIELAQKLAEVFSTLHQNEIISVECYDDTLTEV